MAAISRERASPQSFARVTDANRQLQLGVVQTSEDREVAPAPTPRSAALDYNVQLGTRYAHTPAGDLYYLGRATMRNETGPDGPGYYKKNGNDIIKLIPGIP